MTVGELLRLSRGERIDSDVLLDIVQELKMTAQLLEKLKRSELP
jgi:hypothetical protein